MDDIRMAAGSGTQLQEFFVTPNMLTPQFWDAIAEAVRWMQDNSDVLADTHGIGGDPGRGQPYGYASWSPRKGVLTLRNPSNEPAQLAIDVQTAFELPPGAPQRYRLHSPWKHGASGSQLVLQAGQEHELQLSPFEVLVLEATPAD
jgi:hypothetical protein